MKTILKRNFGLTDSGIRMVRRAALASFFVNAGYMALMLIAMYYGDNVLKGVIRPAWYYLGIIAVTLAVLYILIDREYVLTFNGTYQEATNLRLEIADQIKKLPLSYFSRHDLSDLAQTIMQDVTDLEHAMSHSIPRCIAYVFFLTVMAVLLLVSNPLLGLAALIPLAVGLVLMLLSQRAQKRWTEKYFWKMRETTEAFQEAIELQREVKSCRYEDKNYQELSASLDAAERLRVRTELMQSMPILLSTAVMKLKHRACRGSLRGAPADQRCPDDLCDRLFAGFHASDGRGRSHGGLFRRVLLSERQSQADRRTQKHADAAGEKTGAGAF